MDNLFMVEQERGSLSVKLTSRRSGAIFSFTPVEVIPDDVDGVTKWVFHDDLGDLHVAEISSDSRPKEGELELAWAFYHVNEGDK